MRSECVLDYSHGSWETFFHRQVSKSSWTMDWSKVLIHSKPFFGVDQLSKYIQIYPAICTLWPSFLKIHLPNSSICFVDSACFCCTPMLFDMAKQLTPESPSMSHLHTMSTTQHKHILGTTRSRKGEHWKPSRRDPATGSIPPWIPVLWGPGLPMSMMSMLVAGKKTKQLRVNGETWWNQHFFFFLFFFHCIKNPCYP